MCCILSAAANHQASDRPQNVRKGTEETANLTDGNPASWAMTTTHRLSNCKNSITLAGSNADAFTVYHLSGWESDQKGRIKKMREQAQNRVPSAKPHTTKRRHKWYFWLSQKWHLHLVNQESIIWLAPVRASAWQTPATSWRKWPLNSQPAALPSLTLFPSVHKGVHFV